LNFDVAFASVLQRSIKTMTIILKENNLTKIPVFKTFRLNERHYGGLTGLNKKETAKIHGDEQVHKWRRSYKTKPPKSSKEFTQSLRNDTKYSDLNTIPDSESLKDTVNRVSPFIKNTLINHLNSSDDVLIAAHGNSIRAILKITEDISDSEISKIEIPTGKPILVKFNIKEMKFNKHEYLK
jgi:2,3-bisphosphoglycerate-dependent phosphoglycerate mutase